MIQCRTDGCLAPIDPVYDPEYCPCCVMCQAIGQDMDAPSGSVCDEPSKVRKHNHYFKDVAHLDQVDLYRILKLYNVTDQCLGHAIKKLMCAGIRGAKNVDKDIQEAIDTLLRYQEMRIEDLGA